MYHNKTTLEGVSGFTAFSNYYYWSSTELANNFAWIQGFFSGDQGADNKNNTYYVRAVRAF